MPPEASSDSACPEPRRRLHPVIGIFLSQAIALAIVFVGGRFLVEAGWLDGIPLLGLLGISGALAAAIGWPIGLRQGWLILQASLPLAFNQAMQLAVPAWIYLASFAVLLLVFRNSAFGRVPLYLTNRRTHAALAASLPAGPLTFVDLGCGLGGVVLSLGRARPEARFLGIESAPLPFAASWLRRSLFGPPNVAVTYGNFWNRSLESFDVVYCFLSPVPMAALYRKARSEMKPGSLLISNSFVVPEVPADRVVEVDDGRRTRLNVWEFGRRP